MRIGIVSIVAALLLCAASSAKAGYVITLTQSSSGAITAALDVTLAPCGDGPFDIFNISRSGNQITVESGVYIHSPGCTPPSPAHYQLTASLGTLSDGDYALSWTGPGGPPVFATASFQVIGGRLVFIPNPVPALGAPALVLTALAIVLLGLVRIARR